VTGNRIASYAAGERDIADRRALRVLSCDRSVEVGRAANREADIRVIAGQYGSVFLATPAGSTYPPVDRAALQRIDEV
jgi:hypothetical protein